MKSLTLKTALTLGLISAYGLSVYGFEAQASELPQEDAFDWVQLYKGDGTSTHEAVAQSTDGGYVVAGGSSSTDAGFANKGGTDATLAKYDKDGNQEWIRNFGGSGGDVFSTAALTADGGYIAAGYSTSTNAGFTNKGSADAILVKYDQQGNQEWARSFGGSSAEYFQSVIQTSDGGYVVVGHSYSTNAGFTNRGNTDAILVKYTAQGTQEWVKNFGGNDSDGFSSVIQTPDGGYLAAGNSTSTNAGFTNKGNFDAILVKYNAQGTQQWVKSFGGSGVDSFDSVIALDDGYLAVGFSGSSDAGVSTNGGRDGLLIKYNESGSQEWVKSLGGSGNDEFYEVIKISDGGYAVAGYSGSKDAGFVNQGNNDAVLIKYDDNHEQEWLKSFGTSDSDQFRSLVQTVNGDLISVGYSSSGDAILAKSSKSHQDSPNNEGNTTINGNIAATVISFTVPTELSFMVNPNASEGERFVAPEFMVSNDSNSPLTLSVGTFEETTEFFTDVHGDRYQDSEWDKLGVKDSKQFALALNLEEGESWLVQTQLESLYAKSVQDAELAVELGTIRPNSDVAFNFSAKHGLAFKEALSPEYSITFIFDLFNE